MTGEPAVDELVQIAREMVDIMLDSIGDTLDHLDVVLLVKRVRQPEVGVFSRIHADGSDAAAMLLEMLRAAGDQAVADSARRLDG